MKLYHLSIIGGFTNELEICDCPKTLLSSRTGLTNFLRLHAGRVFGGREGRDWRICADDRALVPLSVNQLVPVKPGDGPGALTGCMEYGDQLIIK